MALSGTRTGERYVLGGRRGPTDPLLLRDGHFLRLSMSLFREYSEKVDRVVLKVRNAGAQYQLDPPGDQWIFRYDYLRYPEGADPGAHLQIRGDLRESGVLPSKRLLERVRFPTGRFSLEGIIRLLAETFGVQTRVDASLWRPVLAESERAFMAIAHQPLSGPEA